MPSLLVQRLWTVGRGVLFCLYLLALLVQSYGLYVAAALMPHPSWRRRLDFHVRRLMFAMDNLHLAGQEDRFAAHNSPSALVTPSGAVERT